MSVAVIAWAYTAAVGAACAVSAEPPPPERVRALEALPGLGLSKLPPQAKLALAEFLDDEFDYCGKPLTLSASLEKGDACAHTRRLARIAVDLARGGAWASDIANVLGRYHETFARPRAALAPDERQCSGPKDAPLTLVVFSDFECPACGAAVPVLSEFARRSKAPVRHCAMVFPLIGHPHATLAAQAVLFARGAGKFWAVHDALFARQHALSDAAVRAILAELKLDVKAFEAVLGAQSLMSQVHDSKDAGQRAGVTGTPTLFLNGRKLVLPGPLSVELLTALADDELDWIASKNSWTAPEP